MPRILLAILMILSFPCLSHAQFSKGSLLVGGELAYSSYSTNDNNPVQSSHSGNFNVSIGKSISENTVFGINLTY